MKRKSILFPVIFALVIPMLAVLQGCPRFDPEDPDEEPEDEEPEDPDEEPADAETDEDPDEDLALPLVRLGLLRPAACEGLHHVLKRGLLFESLVESRSTMAVHSLGAHYNNATLLNRGLCRSHSLYCLVYVPVHGVSTVCCDNYVGRNSLNLALLDQEISPHLMGSATVASNSKHRLVGCVYYHIDYEGQPGFLCCIKHIAVNRIVYKKSGAGMV